MTWVTPTEVPPPQRPSGLGLHGCLLGLCSELVDEGNK